MKRILLAMGHEEYHSIFRKYLKSDFKVSMNDVYNLRYLTDIVDEERPDYIIFHDQHLGITLDENYTGDEAYYREVKILDFIEYARHRYDDQIRIVIVCERQIGDPFLSELVNNNVLDIFYRREFDIVELIHQLLEPTKYANVSHLKVENSSQIYKQSLYTEDSLSGQIIITPDDNKDEIIEQKKKEDMEEQENNVQTSAAKPETKKTKKQGLFSKLFSMGGKAVNTEQDVLTEEKIKEVVSPQVDDSVKIVKDLKDELNISEEEPKEKHVEETVIEEEKEAVEEIIEQKETSEIHNVEPQVIEKIEAKELKRVEDDIQEVELSKVDIKIQQPETTLELESTLTRSDKNKQKRGIFSFFNNGEKSDDKEEYSTIKRRNLFNVKQNVIAVVSLTPGAGATFFLHNFTRYLSLQCGVQSSVLDTPSEFPMWYHLLKEEQEPHQHWKDIHSLIKDQPTTYIHAPKWNIDDIFYFPTTKGIRNGITNDFTSLQAKELLYYSRMTFTTFVDLSHTWDNSLAQETLAICDQLWIVAEPNFQGFKSAEINHQKIGMVLERIGEENVIMIGNKWGTSKEIPLIPEIKLPYFIEQQIASHKNKPLFKLKPKLFEKEFEKLIDYLVQ